MTFFKRPLMVLVLLLMALVPLGLTHSTANAQNNRYFPETGYAIPNDAIWNYFQGRGGVDTFGYPVSNVFTLQGFQVQVFQRHVLQVSNNAARPLNLLDPSLMPVTVVNGSTFPAYNADIAADAPAPNTPNYGDAVVEYISDTVPNTWEGASVGFQNYFYSAAPASGSGQRALVALEVWGFPTSAPARDPNNSNFIYQRFQRGIMHYDATTGVTRGILLGDAFKSVMTGNNLPADLAQNLANSPFLRLYAPGQPNSMARTAPNFDPPITRENTNLDNAFVPSENPPVGTPVASTTATVAATGTAATATVTATGTPATATPGTTTPTATATAGTTTPTATPEVVSQAQVFLIGVDTGGPIGCNDSAVPITVSIDPTNQPLQPALEALFAIKTEYYPQTELYNSLYRSDLQVQSIETANGLTTVNLVGEYQIGGTCDEPRVVAQLEQTALQFDYVQDVEFTINGNPID